MSTNPELTIIKSKLKTWEKEFKKSNGRDPNKSDIKSNPEIAKLYSTYNTTRSNDRKTSHSSKPSTSSTQVSISASTSLMQTTPQKQKAEDKSHAKKSNQINHSSYQHANSPLKLRQLLLSNSPRKKSNGTITTTKTSKKSQSNSTSTPKSNPFESNSGGGTGSPDLFADLLSQGKDTPRTKARKYLIGVGSPLKPKLNRSESSTSGGGLSTFLKARTDESQTKATQIQTHDEIVEDQDSDDVLGPSPFKPKPSGQLPFRCLFDDTEEISQSSQSPIKPNPLVNKLNIKSSLPFIPTNSQTGIGTSAEFPGCAQLDVQKQQQQQQANKNRIPVGAKRKRMKPGEEDASFYEDINDVDPDGLSTIKKVARITTKRTKVDRANSTTIKGKTSQSQLNASTRLSHIKSVDRRDQDGSDSEEEVLGKMPNLPFGAQSQTSVITELETFTFAPTDLHSNPTPTIPQPINPKPKPSKSKPDWKGKGKDTTPPIQTEEDSKQIKVTGTQKVIVRPYKPVNETQKNKLRMTNIFEEPSTNVTESLGPLNDEAVTSEEEEIVEDDVIEEEEGDIIVSEELLNLLNLGPGSGIDRKILRREKAREERVRRVLEGERSKEIIEAKPDPVVPKSSKSIKNQIKKTALQPSVGSSNSKHPKHQRESSVGLGGSEEHELSEDEIEDEDDDWEEDPEGWKEVDGDDGLYTDDYEL